MNFDTIIIGAGLAGICAAERLAREKGERVLVIEQRGHVGGNCHDGYDAQGVLVHTYGPHIFHTESSAVWEYLGQFTCWHPYRHKVAGCIDGRLVPIPFNLNTLHALLPPGQAGRIEGKLLATYGQDHKISVMELSRSDDGELRELAELVLEKIFVNYSRKQWGIPLSELDPQVLGRVPVSVSRDDHYFPDRFQGLPEEGYTAMFGRMLDNPRIEVLLDTPMSELVRCDISSGTVTFRGRRFSGRIVVTGMIDEFFGFAHGELPYRALRFQAERLSVPRFQEVAVVNYPNEHEFTRITEFKHMTGQIHPRTTIMREFPADYARGQAGNGDPPDAKKTPSSDSTNPESTILDLTNPVPCYPILKGESQRMAARYREMLVKFPNVIAVGRLAEFRYYDMDDMVERVLNIRW
jgi:UDP-galactopyranose mutase